MNIERKQHWRKIYETKNPNQVSWTQEKPVKSLKFIHEFNLDKSAKIIDISSGDSKLVDFLLEADFENISVLDISAKALEKAKNCLGSKADKVDWIVSDITQFEPEQTSDVWHDRDAFHFLTETTQIEAYTKIEKKAVQGFLCIGTFSKDDSEKCSGLDISQYDANGLEDVFSPHFNKINCTA